MVDGYWRTAAPKFPSGCSQVLVWENAKTLHSGLLGGSGVERARLDRREPPGRLPETFESSLRCLRPGGTLSSLGVYSGKLQVPYDAFAACLGDHRIVTTLCPGGKEPMRRLMEVVRHGRVDLTPLLTHTFPLDRITEGYRVFGERLDGVLKGAIRP